MTRRLLTVGRDTFASLAVRNVRLFFGGQLVSQVGNWTTLVAQTLLVLHLTDSGVAVGLLAAAQFGPVLLLGPWAGLVADRSDKRRLLLAVQSVAMVQSFVLAAIAFGGAPVWTLYAAAAVGGVTVAFDNPARRSLVVEMVEEEHVPNVVSLNTAMMTLSRVVGPAVAGLLIATVGFGWAFLLDGLSYVAVLTTLFLVRRDELRPAARPARAPGQVRAGLRYAWSLPELRVPLVMMAVIGTLAFNFQTVLPLFVTRSLGGTDVVFTVLFAVLSAGALVGALAVARRRSVVVRTVARAGIGFGAAIAVLAVMPSAAAALPAAFLVGLASVGFLTASTALIQLRAVPEMRGRVLALQGMLFLGSTPVGGPLLGWVADTAGPRWAMGVGALACLGAGAWALRSAPSAPPGEPVADPGAAPAVAA